jgi:hypothetical protein
VLAGELSGVLQGRAAAATAGLASAAGEPESR